MVNLGFIGKKARKINDGEESYATIIGGNGWKYEVIKKYKNDDASDYARWFVNVHGDFTEMGDTYVADIVSMSARLVSVDGRDATAAELADFANLKSALYFANLKSALSRKPGGIRIFG